MVNATRRELRGRKRIGAFLCKRAPKMEKVLVLFQTYILKEINERQKPYSAL